MKRIEIAFTACFIALIIGCEQPKPATSTPTTPVEKAAVVPDALPKCSDCVPVTVENFPRAESDLSFGNVVKGGGFAKFWHKREPASIDDRVVIRPNRDTLYTVGVFDLDAGPVTINMPDAGKRYMALQVINEDQYTPMVVYGKGNYTLAKDKMGTRYVLVGIRTLADPNNPADLDEVHKLQDAMTITQKNPGTFEVPKWDPASQNKVRDALIVLSSTLPDLTNAFGPKGKIDPVRHLLTSASAWGGNPDKDALYLNVTPKQNDGKTMYKLHVDKGVPVDGFWSVSLYDAKGYYEKNPYNAYTLNNITAQKEADGSVNIQFGGCDGKVPNCLPIMDDWNYMVRLYRPRTEVLTGKWKFPEAQPAS